MKRLTEEIYETSDDLNFKFCIVLPYFILENNCSQCYEVTNMLTICLVWGMGPFKITDPLELSFVALELKRLETSDLCQLILD